MASIASVCTKKLLCPLCTSISAIGTSPRLVKVQLRRWLFFDHMLERLFNLNIVSIVASCPSGWIKSTQSGTCIKLYQDKKSWTDARAACQAAGGDLVKILDDSMNQFIWGE